MACCRPPPITACWMRSAIWMSFPTARGPRRSNKRPRAREGDCSRVLFRSIQHAVIGDGMLPPTANYRMLDAECDLDVIPNRARAAQVEYALSNSFAFGGLNAVLAFKKA